jgi:hypothetical protein
MLPPCLAKPSKAQEELKTHIPNAYRHRDPLLPLLLQLSMTDMVGK